MKIAIYNMHFATLGGGERRTSALAAHLARTHEVTLFVHSPVPAAAIKRVFGLDISDVDIVPLEGCDHQAELLRWAPDVFINNSYGSTLINPAPVGVYMCMFPDLQPVDLGSYQTITANSEFTAGWVLKRWGRRAEVVYSACEDMGPAAEKENLILNVGRFFADAENAHHKRQDVLLRAFKQMVDEGARGWRLRLMGNVSGEDADRAFVDDLRTAAAGYPVSIRPGAPFDELRDSFRRSSIYWHATGFGTDEDAEPSKQEHFGMTIVEAMSAAAAPVAFNSGGPRETIRPGVNGYLWSDEAELRRLTLRLMTDRGHREDLAAAAAATSKSYNVAAFLARMDRLIEGKL